jgi:hypothetical protein
VPEARRGLEKIARSAGQQALCIITGEMVPLATMHGTLVLPGLAKHEGAKGGKRIYFDADSTPLLLGSPSSGRTAWSSARPGRSASARLYPPTGCVTPTAHAIDRGASLPEVQSTLGHGDIATTSARPNTSSGLHLDPGSFFDEEPGKGKRLWR